ncbi:MAG TPA: VCBS repeat-containing protein [Planctomycetota bacterium]|nr:VCBS repeat-containing protein [Planctomycetota bacterium]
MRSSAAVLAVVLAVLAVLAGARTTSAGELVFTDHMKSLGLAEPGYAWHAYHDAIVCADWDGDGDVDVLVVTSLHEKGPKGSQGRLYVNLLAESGKLAFEDRTEKLVPDDTHKKIMADGRPYFIDVDADGDLDLCVISDEHHPLTFISEGGVFRMKNWGFNAQSLTVRDLDGDGDLDVIGNDTGLIYTNAGDGTFTSAKAEGALGGHMPRDKVLPVPPGITVDDEAKTKAAEPKGHVYYAWKKIDFTGDGTDDYALFLSSVYSWKLARFYAKTADGYRDVTKETGLPTDAEIHFVDVTGDGKPDVVATQRGTGGVFVGDGKGHFAAAERSDASVVFSNTAGGCYPAPQAVVDFDADGVSDILAYHYRAGSTSSVLQGLGGGRFARVLSTRAGSGQAIADLNNDGLPDVVASGPSNSTGLHVWINETKDPGRRLVVTLKGSKSNPFAVNAVVEAYVAGKQGAADGRIARASQTVDGLPVILGLGRHERVDLRVTFAPGVVREITGVPAGTVTVTHPGP